MENEYSINKTLALTGAIMVWLPLLAPIILCLTLLARTGIFSFDYLLPAELFFIELAGCGLLIAAAHRAQSQQLLITSGFVAALVFLSLTQVYAISTSMNLLPFLAASGMRNSLITGGIVAYELTLVIVGIGGILLSIKVFKNP